MKKILFVASVYAHLAAFHKPFMKRFQEEGFEVHVAGSPIMNRKEELLNMGAICHDIDFDRLPFSNKNKKALMELHVLFEEHYFNLIHVHTPTAAFLTRYVVSKHNQGKVLYTVHGFHFFKGAPLKNWLLFYPAEKLAKRWTDALIVMNDEDYNLGEKIGFIENQNLFQVHGVGVDLHEFHIGLEINRGIKEELGLRRDTVVISCVAELSTRKNQLFLLSNWRNIVEACPNVHLLLVGEGKEKEKEKIRSFINRHDLKHVHLLGYRSDVPNIIASSDIVTLVSKQEGLPRCLMEAMACRKPIITTNARGSKDLVDNGKSGMVVTLGDNKNLVKSFTTLIKDEQLRIYYGKNGLNKIQKYSITNVVNEMDKIYSLLL